MKRFISCILTIAILLTTFPLALSASATEEEEYIYNSDLFYGYSSYLTETYNLPLSTLELHRMETTHNIIHQEFIHSFNNGSISICLSIISCLIEPYALTKITLNSFSVILTEQEIFTGIRQKIKAMYSLCGWFAVNCCFHIDYLSFVFIGLHQYIGRQIKQLNTFY